MTPAARNVIFGAPFDPYRLGNNAAAYSLSGSPANATYLYDGSNRLYYVADRSGNSEVNGLVLPGVATNYASTPNAAANQIAADIALVGKCSLASLAASQCIIGKWASGNQNYLFYSNSSGGLTMEYSTNGSSNTIKNSTVTLASVGIAAFATWWLAVTQDVDNGAAGNDVKFWYSTNGTTWTQLGATVTTAGAITRFSSTSVVEIGSIRASLLPLTGIIERATIYNGIPTAFGGAGGTVAFDANFTIAAKFATSFTESSSNAATVTITQTAIALPARIHGARDLYQGLTASMPTFSVSGGYNIATFDGTADYLKSADFAGSTSASVYLTGSGVSWTDLRCLADFTQGANAGLLQIRQNTTTPNIGFLNSGGTQANTTELALGVRGVISVVNTAGGVNSIRINQLAANAGVAVSNSFGGVTLFARWATSTADRFANGTFSALLVRSVADNASNELRINRYFMRLGGIAG